MAHGPTAAEVEQQGRAVAAEDVAEDDVRAAAGKHRLAAAESAATEAGVAKTVSVGSPRRNVQRKQLASSIVRRRTLARRTLPRT